MRFEIRDRTGTLGWKLGWGLTMRLKLKWVRGDGGGGCGVRVKALLIEKLGSTSIVTALYFTNR